MIWSRWAIVRAEFEALKCDLIISIREAVNSAIVSCLLGIGAADVASTRSEARGSADLFVCNSNVSTTRPTEGLYAPEGPSGPPGNMQRRCG